VAEQAARLSPLLAPVIVKKISGRRFAYPLDGGVTFIDRRPLFGSSKTVRGIFVSILFTTARAPLVGLDPKIGALIAGTAMAGDLISRFAKRCMKLQPRSRAAGLDQVPEALVPLLASRDVRSLTAADIALGVGIFFVGELILSRLLYKARLRDEPYWLAISRAAGDAG
jgi:hypothetical protein